MIPKRNLKAWKTKQNLAKKSSISKKILDVGNKVKPNTFELSGGIPHILKGKAIWKLKK
jgi:hypothetical protein